MNAILDRVLLSFVGDVKVKDLTPVLKTRVGLSNASSRMDTKPKNLILTKRPMKRYERY